MTKTDFTPSIDTSSVDLPDDLIALTEVIARHVHEVWTQGRIAEGWQWGVVRDDDLRHHPCLVSYDDLSNSEREYDRLTALETLKLIKKLGWKIEK